MRGSGRIPEWKSREEAGQALSEYAVILLFVAMACFAAATLLGSSVNGFYNGFSGSF